jgi:hypothetical protein
VATLSTVAIWKSASNRLQWVEGLTLVHAVATLSTVAIWKSASLPRTASRCAAPSAASACTRCAAGFQFQFNSKATWFRI